MKTLFKKFFVLCAVIAAISATLSFTTAQPVNAAEGFTGNCRYLLGLTSWDCGVTITDVNSLKANIWTIVANVVADITVIAAYLIIGYVIYGGYLYMSSSGDPSKVTAGKKTLTHAFIGLAIVMLANIIMNTIRIALIGDKAITNCATSNCVDANAMVTSVIQWVIGIAGIVAAAFVVIGGISYMTSAGDPSKAQKARNTIIYALIGLAIVALAEVITAFVSSTIRDSISQTNLTTISKEVHLNETKVN